MTAGITAERTDRMSARGSDERRRLERELVALYQRDPASRDRVVAALLPLAQSIARRYRRGEEPMDDLMQVASLGLLKALKRFDPEHGTSFAGFAVPTIRGELLRHYRDTGWAVHVPRGVQELALKLKDAERHNPSGRAPTARELAERFDVDVEAVVEARLASRAMRTSSLDRPAFSGQDDGEDLIDRFSSGPDDEYELAEHRATLTELTKRLSDRDRQIVALRFGEDLSQSEIGRRVGVSQMQVSRILRRVLDELHAEATAPPAAV